jgi:hypothetical protein
MNCSFINCGEFIIPPKQLLAPHVVSQLQDPFKNKVLLELGGWRSRELALKHKFTFAFSAVGLNSWSPTLTSV